MLRVYAFVHDERGSVTMEFVLWVPLFVFLLCFTVDAALLYLTHSEMFYVARTTAREISVGALAVADAPQFANSKIVLAGRTYTFSALSGSLVIVTISVNIADATVFGLMESVYANANSVLGRTMIARVEMRREPTVSITPPPPVI